MKLYATLQDANNKGKRLATMGSDSNIIATYTHKGAITYIVSVDCAGILVTDASGNTLLNADTKRQNA